MSMVSEKSGQRVDDNRSQGQRVLINPYQTGQNEEKQRDSKSAGRQIGAQNEKEPEKKKDQSTGIKGFISKLFNPK